MHRLPLLLPERDALIPLRHFFSPDPFPWSGLFYSQKGEAIYEKACVKCHDEGGSLPGDDAGILAGQWLPYLQYSMEDFLGGTREMPKKMKNQIDKLSPEEIEASLHYFASQK